MDYFCFDSPAANFRGLAADLLRGVAEYLSVPDIFELSQCTRFAKQVLTPEVWASVTVSSAYDLGWEDVVVTNRGTLQIPRRFIREPHEYRAFMDPALVKFLAVPFLDDGDTRFYGMMLDLARAH